MFGDPSVKSMKEREDSSVSVVVLLLTKPTLSGLSVGNKQPSRLLDRYNDRGALIFIVTAPGPDATSRRPPIFGSSR